MNSKTREAVFLKKSTMLANSGMDGPTVPWTVGDLFMVNSRLFLTYHVMFSGWDYMTPLGCAVGALALPKVSKYSHLTPLQAAGTGGLMAGCAGMGLGFLLMEKIAFSKENKIPFDKDGIQMRVDGLAHNYRVRAMDLGVWLGAAAGGAALVYKGGPVALGLSAAKLGTLQAVALGSAAGSIGANIFIAMTK